MEEHELNAKLTSPEVVAAIGWAVRGWLPPDVRELVERKAAQMRAEGVAMPAEFSLTTVHLSPEEIRARRFPTPLAAA